jgi:hypothetical protein
MDLHKLRWQALGMIGVQFQYLKNFIRTKYQIEVEESNFEEFARHIEKYKTLNHDDALFELEDIAFRKILVFTLREKELEEIINPIFRQQFLNNNRMQRIIESKTIRHIERPLYPCYVKFGARYAVIKMAQLRTYMGDDVDEDNVVTSSPKQYYHCAKFVIDLENGLVFLFYNDINNEEEEGNWKSRAVTEKKQAFYNLFSEGTQFTLLKCGFEGELYNYIKQYLDTLKCNDYKGDGPVIVIETSDPDEGKNSLRSSKIDGNHNIHRLEAIRYALEYERHTVKTIELIINGRWVQVKNYGEIITSGPYLSREVIKSVCEEIFPNYKLSERIAEEHQI